MNDSPERKSALRRRRRWRQLLGAVVCLLVVIGLVSVVSGGVRLTATLFDDSELKRPNMCCVCATLWRWSLCPGDSIEEANQNTLLNALIWSSISEDKDYERDEVGAMYLPTADIDTAAAELYGPDVHFTYQTL